MVLKDKILNWYEKYCYEHKIDSDLYDIEAKIDSNITAEENINAIEEDLRILAENGTLLKEQVKQEKARNLSTKAVFSINLDLTDSVAIVGDRNSGKTNLAFGLLNNYSGTKAKYLYGYPKEIPGFKLISTWSDLLKLTDSVIFIDEIQKYIKLYDRRANAELMELLSFLAQQNNTLIFTTQLSQFITKGVEASIQTWLIKQLDIRGLKNGCKIKRILQETANPRITEKGMAIYLNEYIAYDSTMPIGFNGIHTFGDQGIGKDWKIATKIPTKTAKVV
jgi:hypothetical protein